MVRAKKKILSVSERMVLEDEKREAEGLKATMRDETGFKRGIDEGALNSRIVHMDKELHDGRAPRMTAVKKDEAAKEFREIESKLKDGMPSRSEMAHPGRHPGAIQKHMAWDRHNKENIRRYKELARRIEPEAPANYENLRKDK